MRVWITRSEPGATRLASHLEGLGYHCRLAPLIRIEPTHSRAPHCASSTPGASGFEHVIFLSEHAVICALQQPSPVVAQAQWYAIGPTTAAALERFAPSSVTTPGVASSEGLLALSGLAVVQGQAVLVVAGEDGRDTLVPELRRRGARVERWCVYRRALIMSQSLQPQVHDVCVASSAMALEPLTAKWVSAGGELSAPVCVPSQRVADVAKQLGWSQVWVSDGPTPAAVAQCLGTRTLRQT